MRSGIAAGHTGYFHEAVYYRCADELLAVAVPFLLGGVAAGEPTMVALGEEHAGLVREATGGNPGITYLAGGEMYARPASAIRAYRALLAGHVAAGAGQIRIIGELSPWMFGRTWDWWSRYESAINHAYDDFPLWSMCAYHAEQTPEHVLREVARTHPWVAEPGGHRPSPSYTEPAAFLMESRPPADDPIQRGRPVVELTDPLPASARQAVVAADPGTLPAGAVDNLVVAVSEIVTNAIAYGQAPVRLRLWAGADRIVVTVSDQGPGPKDPYAGLLPRSDGEPGGLGLWLTHQLCDHVTLDRRDTGFAIRLTAGGSTAD
ncbi:sensor histidine kinase [Luedemannella helvata]|uniref:Anti-sigma factor RsbA family regulatory protein n=1 Tax=Luedemannella helvata TaxID=349315 RepID=A0ABN2KHG6_9ACTN